jgi:hypothetical protein
MARQIQGAERRKLAEQAVNLDVRGASFTEIGKQLGISRQLSSTLVYEELARSAEHRDQDKERAIAHYKQIIRTTWTKLHDLGNRSPNALVGLLNTNINAQARIDRLTGAEAPRRGSLDINLIDPVSDEDLSLLDSMEEFFANRKAEEEDS